MQMIAHIKIHMLTLDRCVMNCDRRTVIQEAVEVKLTMNSSSISPPSIEWSMTPPIDWQRDSGTGNNWQTLSIHKNVLQPGTIYTISVEGKLLILIL